MKKILKESQSTGFALMIGIFAYESLEDALKQHEEWTLYTNKAEFLKEVVEIYKAMVEMYGEDDELDVPKLHSNPLMQDLLKSKQKPRKRIEDMNWEELQQLKHWPTLIEHYCFCYQF